MNRSLKSLKELLEGLLFPDVMSVHLIEKLTAKKYRNEEHFITDLNLVELEYVMRFVAINIQFIRLELVKVDEKQKKRLEHLCRIWNRGFAWDLDYAYNLGNQLIIELNEVLTGQGEDDETE